MRDFFINNINKKLKDKEYPKVDLHTHTNWTDGNNTVNEMFEEAIKKDIDHIFFSEHSRSNSGEWFKKFVEEVVSLDKTSCKAYAGTEVKVLDYNGKLDINDNIENLSKFIMASVHRFPGEIGNIKENKNNYDPEHAVKIEYELSLAAIENPKTLILGHPFGMSIKRFNILPDKKLFDDIILKCKKYDKVFEVNANYHPNVNYLIEECLKHNTIISLGSNAHSADEIGLILKLIKL